MAIRQASFLSYLLYSFFILLLCCSCDKVKAYGRERLEAAINSRLPAASCSLFPQCYNHSTKLQIVHKNGPCSQSDLVKNTTFSPLQILLHDQLRLQSIHSRISNAISGGQFRASIPAKFGLPLGMAEYIVKVGFGTPTQYFTLFFDTGSSVTWIQCQPCAISCYQQLEPIFDPSNSSSYSFIPCDSDYCSQLIPAVYSVQPCNSTSTTISTCTYQITYMDNFTSIGYFGLDTLTLSSDVFPGFQFGCSQGTRGDNGMIAGTLGLGRDQVSLVSQTAKTYGEIFSYCLPSSNSLGYLAFGSQAGTGSTSIKYTPLVIDLNAPSFYVVQLIGISVGGRNLSIPPSVFKSPGTIIDSGTTLTYLPPSAYAALRSAFRQGMTNYPPAPPLSPDGLDTCYDLSKSATNVVTPSVVFYFEGGASLDVDLTGRVIGDSSLSQVCLAFAATSSPNEFGVLGNLLQQTYEVIYDVAGQRLGFGSGGCT
uniref:Peptidase A1 domain-containing protein n=1 Tax=Nelumbo nucifera TaxID=4432 RepID=A0A822XY90_NELNU|nr:TPA_asm: hypothetical protein HUJ06_026446 [Nelumbo nucifera]